MIKKITHKYFIRYFIPFTIPIFCLGILFFYNNITYTNKASENYNMALLQQFASEFDSILLKNQNTALHMSGDNLILSFNNKTATTNNSQTPELLKLLKSYEVNLTGDVTLALYPRGGDLIYLEDEIIPYTEFEKTKEYEFALSISGFFTKLNGISSEYSFQIKNPYKNATEYAAIVMYPIPTIAANPTSTVCFMIKDTKFIKTTQRFFGNTPVKVYVFNSSYQKIYASDQSEIPEVISAIKNNYLGISEYEKDGSKQVLMRTISDNSNYQYIVSMPKDVFYHAGQSRMSFLILLMAVLVIFSVIMAVLLAKNYYKSIANVETKKQEIAVELNNQCLIVIELVLKRLLNGSLRHPKQLEYNLNCANIIFDKKSFTVITVLFNNCFLIEEQVDELTRNIKLMNTNLSSFYPVKIQEENKISVILNFEAEEVSIPAIVEDLYDYISGFALYDFEIGCGGIYEYPVNICNAFVESIVAVSEKINVQKGRCYVFENAPESEEGFYYPHIEEAVIQQSIKNGNPDIAIFSLSNIFRKIQQVATSNLIFKCLYYDMVNMIVKIASAIGFPLKSREISELSGYESLEMLQQKIEEIIKSLSKSTMEFNEHRANSTKLKVIEYVQKNYTDNNLSLDTLANEFDLSYSYASKIFKEETGQNFLSYITQLRFNFIKKQLSDTDIPIKDIITQAGYLDAANFMRKFKQSEGITLGQYRQSRHK